MLKKKLLGIIGAISLFAMTGCASGPTFSEHAETMQPVSAENGRIYIYRVATLGAAVQPKVRLNDVEVGKAAPKGFFYVDRPAGNYEVAASTEAERNLSMTLEAGEEKYVRLEMKMGLFAGHVKPVLVDAEVGREEIQKTKYIGAVDGT
ncbi:MAG: DUF2846 domain-containing protein [Pseudomonadota bacterium]